MTQPVNDEPPVDARNYIHHVLVGLHALTRLHPALIALGVVVFAALVGVAWGAIARSGWAWLAGGAYLLALLGDWAWLASLPRRGLSYGPVEPPLVGLALLRAGLAVSPLVGLAFRLPVSAMTWIGVGLQGAATGAMIYASAVEPFRLGVTHLKLSTLRLPAGCRVRLVHLSDLHIERITRRERELVARVRALDADYVLLTGDYLNFSYVGEPEAMAHARRVLGALHARRGIYAVRGTHQVDPNAVLSALFEGLSIRWLRNEHVALEGIPGGAFTVLLYHAPELVPEAAALGVDLYLSGHTHGGQIRLPLYGALVTATDAGKRYEMGRYDIGGMTLYVNRGIGMEGMAAPRVRVLCPPEIACIDVMGTG